MSLSLSAHQTSNNLLFPRYCIVKIIHYLLHLIVYSQKNTSYNSSKIKGNEVINGEEKRRLSSSAKMVRDGVGKSVYLKEVPSMYPKSATLRDLPRKRPLPGLNGSKTEKTPFSVRDYHLNLFQESSDDGFDDVFYTPVLPSVEQDQTITENKKSHDPITLKVLQTEFSASSGSTYGLARAASPENTNSQNRYWALINQAIESNVVTPLSSVWIGNTHRFVPIELRDRFANILKGITQVSSLT